MALQLGLGGGPIDDQALPDPFRTHSSTFIPRTVENMLRWAESLWFRNPTYAAAMRRTCAYFLTRVEIKCDSDDEKEKYVRFLNEQQQVLLECLHVGIDFACYGNAIRSVYVPFRRFLKCSNPRCGTELPIERIKFEFGSFKFSFVCPGCNQPTTQEKPIDRPSLDETKIKVIRWSPHEIRIRYNRISRQSKYYWDPPADVMDEVRRGDPFTLCTLPWEMIESIRNRKLFEFNPRVIWHLKDDPPSGVLNRGWGITRQLNSFCQAFYKKMLEYANEVIANEYVVPFRLLTPDKQAVMDPFKGGMGASLGVNRNQVLSMLKQHRRQPGGFFYVPIPMNYQDLSGDAQKYSPSQLIEQAEDSLLNSAGVPAELYRGTLTLETAPSSLRMFQQNWVDLVGGYNSFLSWLTETLAFAMNWEQVESSLVPPSVADDMENRQFLLQAAASGQLSKELAYSAINVDWRNDVKKRYDEQRIELEAQQKFQQEQENRQTMMQQIQSGPAQAAGATPAPGSTADSSNGQPSTSVGDKMQQADQLADQFLAMPDAARKGELLKLRKTDETLWALVKSKLQTKRQGAASQGQQQVLQQHAQQMQQTGQSTVGGSG